MATLQDSNRIMHTRADRFVSMAALKDGIVDGAAQFGLNLNAYVVVNKVFKKRQECVRVVVKDKHIPDLYLTHTSMGTIPYLDMFTVGHRDLMHMAGSMALAGTVDLFRPRSVGDGTRALVGGLIGAHGGKKIARDHAVTDDFLDVFLNDVVPYAYQCALNADASGAPGAEPTQPPAVPVAPPVSPPTPDPREAAEQARQAAEQAERERQAQEAAAAAERARQQREAAERARQAAEQAERARQQREAAAAAERARQAAEQAERERLAREAAERRRREEEARKATAAAKQAAARTAEANTLNKLVFITREEARTGCVKTIEVEKGRQVTVSIPAGVTYDSHVELPGEGRMDVEAGVRGILRLSFAYSD